MKSVFIFLVVLVGYSGFSQEVESQRHRIPSFTVKWSPLHLVNYYPTFQVAIEQRLSESFSLQADLGPIINVNGIGRQESALCFDRRGFKAKLDLRYYIAPHNKYWRFYYGPEVYWNWVNYKKEERFGMNCVDGRCDYFQAITYGMQYREPGINLKTGALFHVNRFCIDFHIGVSLRFINYNSLNKPANGNNGLDFNDNYDFFNFDPPEEDRTKISPIACVRFGYILK